MFRSVTAKVRVLSVLPSILPIIIALALSIETRAQTSGTLHDAYTPTGLEQGAPAGSYQLSGFETINPYNGNLSVALPLMRVGGRGSAGHTITLPIDLHWEVLRDGVTTLGILDETLFRSGETWQVGYSPGFLEGNTVMEGTFNGSCPPSAFRYFLTRLRFIMPDGTEEQLYDKKYQGAARSAEVACTFPVNYPNRGKVFVTADGES